VSGMRFRHVLPLVAAVLLALTACGEDDEDDEDGDATTGTPGTTAAAESETRLAIHFWSGSIPPPYNHEYELDLTVGAGGVEADYRLTYNYRDELAELPPDADQDVAWQGTLDAATAEQARALADDPGLQPPEDDPPVGGSSWEIAVRGADGETASGTPGDPDAWQALGCAVDAQARQSLGRDGAAQSC
jgi:hypothetical protein